MRDQLMALQPLLLRIEPGTEQEQVGFRHPAIAAQVRARHGSGRSTITSIDTPHHDVHELQELFDHEAPEPYSGGIRDHLDECDACLATYSALEKIKQKTARSGGGDRAPEGLRDRIHPVTEQADASTWTPEHDPR
ncbi:hypothetical protein [Amycolatopsis sp. NPDC051071]|uniref:hypothetical protein n=1 Tax=Amycolatopsis sp. NPDC051071 TaxID=3154637 RepID=UPI003427A365